MLEIRAVLRNVTTNQPKDCSYNINYSFLSPKIQGLFKFRKCMI